MINLELKLTRKCPLIEIAHQSQFHPTLRTCNVSKLIGICSLPKTLKENQAWESYGAGYHNKRLLDGFIQCITLVIKKNTILLKNIKLTLK